MAWGLGDDCWAKAFRESEMPGELSPGNGGVEKYLKIGGNQPAEPQVPAAIRNTFHQQTHRKRPSAVTKWLL